MPTALNVAHLFIFFLSFAKTQSVTDRTEWQKDLWALVKGGGTTDDIKVLNQLIANSLIFNGSKLENL